MSLNRILRKVITMGGADLALDRPKMSARFLKNLILYALFHRLRLSKLPYYPLVLMIEVSGKCNFVCPRCERMIFPQSELGIHTSLETIKKVSPLFDYAYSVYFVGGLGEPFLNPEFWQIHKIAKEHGVRTGFFTNGSLLDKELENIFKEKVDSVLISVDSADKKTYEKIRVGGKFEKIIGNVKKLVGEKKKRNLKKPEIGLSFSYHAGTLKEMPDFVDFAYGLGVDFLSFAALIAHKPEMINESPYLVPEKTKREIFKEVEKRAKKYQLPVRLPNISISDGEELCPHLWRDLCLFYTGDICTCPYFRNDKTYYFYVDKGKIKQDVIKTPGLIAGNVNREPVLSIWNNQTYQSLRKKMKRGNPPPPCDHCYFRYEIH